MRRPTPPDALLRAPARASSFITLTALSALLSCAQEPDSPASLAPWIESPLEPWPERLSQLGVYPDPERLEAPIKRALRYEPRYPLWTNGSAKLRHLILPAQGQIDNRGAQWSLPVGSVLLKTFSYPASGKDRPIETRLMRRDARGWDYAVYLWDEDGQDARRLDLRRAVEVPVELDQTRFMHAVPNRLECRACHESSQEWTLGLSALQLDASSEAAQTLWAQGRLMAAPAPPLQLDEDPETAWVKGYMVGNCVHCHNGQQHSTNSTYSLMPQDLLDAVILQPTQGNASAAGTRVIPADPDRSVLYQAMRGDDPEGLDERDPELKPMPPLGVQRPDAQAIERLRRWIQALPPSPQ